MGVVGTRGLPFRYGGYETFAHHLVLHMVGENSFISSLGSETNLIQLHPYFLEPQFQEAEENFRPIYVPH